MRFKNGAILPKVLFMGLLLASFALEFALVRYRYDINILRARVPDEALFLDATTGFVRFFESGTGFPEGFPGPYGHPFWLLLTAIEWLARVSRMPVVPFAYFIFLAMKYASAALGFHALSRCLSPWTACFITLAIFLSPGLYFFGKIISPEYMLLLLVIGGTTVLVNNIYIRRVNLGCVLLFFAAYIKILVAPYFASALLVASLCDIRNGRSFRAVSRILATTLSVILIIIISGGARVLVDSITALPTPPFRPSPTAIVDSLLASDFYTWDQIRVSPLVSGFPIVVVAIIVGVISIIIARKAILSYYKNPYALVILISSFMILMLLAGKGMAWSWYLFVPATVIPIVIFHCVSNCLPNWVLITSAVASLAIGAPACIDNMQNELRVRSIVLAAQRDAGLLLAEARSLCGANAPIIFDALLPLDNSLSQAGDVAMLSSAVKNPKFHDVITKAGPFVIVSNQTYKTVVPAFRIVLPPKVNESTSILGSGELSNYIFIVSSACRR